MKTGGILVSPPVGIARPGGRLTSQNTSASCWDVGLPAPQPVVHHTFESLRIRRCNSGLGKYGEMTCLCSSSVRTMMLQHGIRTASRRGLNARRGSSSRSHFPTNPNML